MKFLNPLGVLVIAGVALFGPVSSALAGPKYTFSVVPQYATIELHKDWSPLLARISKETGLVLELKTPSSIPQFEAGFLKGEPDFAFLNPYHAVMAKRAENYIPIIRDNKSLMGDLVVRKDSTVKQLKDLQGQKVAFPAPNAFGASLYMRALFADAGVVIDPIYVKTHSNVYRTVIRKGAAAGGTVNAAFNDEVPEVRDELKVIFQTPPVASHPIVAHPRVPESVRKSVAQAILALSRDEEGRNLLKDVRISQPVTANYDTDYRPLEKLNIDKFVVLE